MKKKEPVLAKKLRKNEKHETRAEEKKETPKEQRIEKKYGIEKHSKKRGK